MTAPAGLLAESDDSENGAAPRGRSFESAIDRWASVGPYYAMFPIEFAFEVIRQYSTPGQAVLDPFAGRASSIYAAATQRRTAVGIEINPVGWLYGRAKLAPAREAAVLQRLQVIAEYALQIDEAKARALPEFFRHCYAPGVLRFLVAAREFLSWRHDRTDGTLMTLILVYLHGKRGATLSNQMRDGKAMAPDYATRWWTERAMTPPDVDVVPFLTKRIKWRYKQGIPRPGATGQVRLGDCTSLLKRLGGEVTRGQRSPFDLLFTSPPYLAVTNYHYDQWLRLWMLGGSDRPQAQEGRWARKFEGRNDYVTLLNTVFVRCAAAMRRRAAVYVRTDAREFTLAATVDALTAAFPQRRISQVARPLVRRSQTALFGDKESKPGEVDLIIR